MARDGAGPSPVVMAAVGALSLAGFAAAGSALRWLRDRDRPAPPPLVATPAPVSRSASPSPASGARGRLVFQVHCARCHGPDGHGDGPDAASLRPPPRDLAAAAWQSSANRDGVRRAVSQGVAGTMMPGLGPSLSAGELDAVVDFVLSLPLVAEPVPPEVVDLLRRAGFVPVPSARPAPPLEARGAGGEAVTLDRLRGKLVLVVFWGTSCAPCLEELPDLERLADRFRDVGLAVLPVCTDEPDADVALRVARDRAPRLPVFVDPTGSARLSYDVQTLPSAALVAPDGHLIGHAQGAMHWSAPGIDSLVRASLPVRPTTGAAGP
jgi:mono/diheme cytochrome c family protein/peroxiredoxin